MAGWDPPENATFVLQAGERRESGESLRLHQSGRNTSFDVWVRGDLVPSRKVVLGGKDRSRCWGGKQNKILNTAPACRGRATDRVK